jgi:hypothetical protein
MVAAFAAYQAGHAVATSAALAPTGRCRAAMSQRVSPGATTTVVAPPVGGSPADVHRGAGDTVGASWPTWTVPAATGRHVPGVAAPEAAGRDVPEVAAPEAAGRDVPGVAAPEAAGRHVSCLAAPVAAGRHMPGVAGSGVPRGPTESDGAVATGVAGHAVVGVFALGLGAAVPPVGGVVVALAVPSTRTDGPSDVPES